MRTTSSKSQRPQLFCHSRVRIDQVAPEQEARDFIVETDGVVADPDRARLAERRLDRRGKLMFRHAPFEALLGRDAGDQARHRVGQEIGAPNLQ
ncbi:hypothetical protein LP420_09620 [Massilia sp. B-10]|nr:hypothetical protein LP420_09620 [Massilia sp. B-10]